MDTSGGNFHESGLLTHRYMKAHKKQTLGAILCIAVFLSGICAILLFYTSSAQNCEEQRRTRTGYHTATLYSVDDALVESSKQELTADGAGLAKASFKIQCPGVIQEQAPYIGYLDENTRFLRHIRLKTGRYPTQDHEVAIEETTLTMLGLTDITPGESLLLTYETDRGLETATFVLTGILCDYMTIWQDEISQIRLRLPSDAFVALPTVILDKEPETSVSTTLVMRHFDRANLYVGYLDENQSSVLPDTIEQSQIHTARVICTALVALTMLLMIVGILNIVEILFQDRELYLRTLRCIGLSRRQCVLLFLLHGLFLGLLAVVLGCLTGSGLYAALIAIVRHWGQAYQCIWTPMPFVLSGIIGLFCVLASFLIKTWTLLGPLPVSPAKQKRRRLRKSNSTSEIRPLWVKANASKHRKQNMLVWIMQAGCVFILIFGIYISEYNAIIMHVQLKEQFQKMDYRLYVAKGVDVTLRTTTPLQMGVTPETMHSLLADSSIQMQFYGNQNTNNANIVYESLDDFPEQVRDTLYWESYGQTDDFSLKQLREAGYKAQEDISFYPIIGIDRALAEQLLAYQSNGQVDLDKFERGEEVILVGDDFNVGMHIPISIPVVAPVALVDQTKIQGNVHIHRFQPTATAKLEDESLCDILPNAILFSFAAMKAADPSLMYDIVIANCQSESVYKSAEQAMSVAKARSYGTALLTRNTVYSMYQDSIQELKIPVYCILALFLPLILLALLLTNLIKIKGNIKEYSLFRAVGLDKAMILSLLLYENLSNCGISVLVGGALGFGLSFLNSRRFSSYVSYLPSVFGLMGLYYIGLCLVLLLLNAFLCVPLKNWIVKRAVIRAIQDVE